MCQQIYAKLKKTSKYFGQAEPSERFPVRLDQQGLNEYVVLGNRKSYRLKDVNLFVLCEDGRELRIA